MDEQKLYIMKNSFGLVKIGISKDPETRANQIRLNSGVSVKVIFVIDCKDSFKVEQMLHRHFKHYRKEGEWFGGITPESIRNKAIVLERDRIPLGQMILGRRLPCMEDPVVFIKNYYRYNANKPQSEKCKVMRDKLGFYWERHIDIEDFPDSRLIFNSIGGCNIILCKDFPCWRDTLKNINYEWFPCEESGNSYIKETKYCNRFSERELRSIRKPS